MYRVNPGTFILCYPGTIDLYKTVGVTVRFDGNRNTREITFFEDFYIFAF